MIALLALSGCSLQLPSVGPNGPVPSQGASASEPTDAESPVPSWTPPVPVVSGAANVGQTLTADPGDWVGASVAYQWYRGDQAINKATKSTYVPGAADYNQTLFVRVTGPDIQGVTTSADSAPTAKIGHLVVNDELIGRIGLTFAELQTQTPAGIAASGTYGGVSRWHDVDNPRIIYGFDAPAKTDPNKPFQPKDSAPSVMVYAPASLVFTGYPAAELAQADFLKVAGAGDVKTRRTATLGRITTFTLGGAPWMMGAVTMVSKDTPFTVGKLNVH